MSRFLLPVIVFAIMIPVFIVGLGRNKSELPSPLLDQQSPQFVLPSLQDPAVTVGSANYAGEVTLVNVWATWCGGCRAEHGYLMDLAARGEVPIFGLNWRDQRSPALNWLQQLGNPYVTSAYDEDGRVGIDWGVYGAPETFLIAADGTVLYKHISPMNEQVWTEEFLPRIQAARGVSQ
jgi:cytochrome c biogenesis protein CcmG/thiol:disulfide interchange protein DsbE